MSQSPSFESFVELARQYRWIPVRRRLLCDSLTPVSAFHRLDSGGSACLFESVIGGEKVGRYSFLAVDPFLELSARRQQVTIRSAEGEQSFECDDPLDELRRRLSEVRVAPLPELKSQPFVGGAIGYAGYDVVRYTERLPHPPVDDRDLPDLSFAFYDRLIVFDNVTKTMTVVVLVAVPDEADLAAVYRQASGRLDDVITQLGTPRPGLDLHEIELDGDPQLAYESNFTQAAYEAAVRRCVEYIRAGDIFQVVISQRLKIQVDADPFDIYRTLRVINPSPFMFFLRTPSATLVGSSPEIMCRVMAGRVTVRPLAGTRPRGRTEEEDQRLAEELLNDPKERAEHIMLVDLGRNDVGRVARYGSVQLSDVLTIERYSHVMHITSNVTGELAPGKDAFAALRACVSAGTGFGGPQSASDGDHRRAGAPSAGAVRRRRRLHRLQWQHGYLHRAAHHGLPGPRRVRPGWRRDCGRQHPFGGIPGDAQQGPRPPESHRNHPALDPRAVNRKAVDCVKLDGKPVRVGRRGRALRREPPERGGR
jgi:anthranilate synthase component I